MKKRFCFLLNIICLAFFSFAQDTKVIKHKLSSILETEYMVLKSNKKIKEGKFLVIDDKKNILVKGFYKNDKKDSIWVYYSPNGEVVQQYDFRENRLLENKEDQFTIVKQKYEIFNGDSVSNDESIEPPIKIGGVNYGFFLLYNIKLVSLQLRTETRLSSPTMSFIFTISPDGKLESWNVKFMETGQDSTIENYSIKDLPPDAYEFIPAKVKGIPVKSKLIYSVVLNVNQDFNPSAGSNNIMMSQRNK